MADEPISFEQIMKTREALDVEFCGKARSCPKCDESFVSRFDRGQCTRCGYVFYASNPAAGNSARSAIPGIALPPIGKDESEVVTLDKMDWREFENVLFDLTQANLRSFAKAHSKECFYGFAFDCNAVYGDVLLCLNSEVGLQRQAEHYKKELAGYKKESLDDIKNQLRWNMGDWKYQGFNSGDFEDGWRVFQATALELCMDEEEDERASTTPTQSNFMDSVCRVALRLVNADAFACLSRTNDFTVYVADHDEWESRSWERLSRVHAELES